jgi:hypothetical protein
MLGRIRRCRRHAPRHRRQETRQTPPQNRSWLSSGEVFLIVQWSNAEDCECNVSYCRWPMCRVYVERERDINMKLTHIIQKPVPTPPNRVILDMTEEEAGLLYYISKYYATNPPTGSANSAAARLYDRLEQYKSKYQSADSCFRLEE